MKGYNACWVPGTDHASIATESKVVNYLKEQGVDKFEIGREEFLKHCHEWREKYGGSTIRWIKESVAPNLKKWGFNTVGVHNSLAIVNKPRPVMPYMLPIHFVDIPHWKPEIPDGCVGSAVGSPAWPTWSGTASSAAAEGVGARISATKSQILKSVSCPTADMTGIFEAATVRASVSSLSI